MNIFKQRKDIKEINREEISDNNYERIVKKDFDELLDECIDHFTTTQGKILNLVQRKLKTKEDLKLEVEKFFRSKRLSKEEIDNLTERFMLFIYGYHTLEELINDDSISDIKVLAFDNIRIKRYGRRETSDVKFKNNKEFIRFINLVATKNKINLSKLNAMQTFTDKYSNATCILRINITTEFINSTDNPYLHIRKIPKVKLTKKELIKLGLFTEEQYNYIVDKVRYGQVIIFTGKGASGKTTLFNKMLDEIEHSKSGLFIQENEELFSDTHPDMMFQHIVNNRGEGKIQYTLKDLAVNGLLIDLDYFGIGEIKGGEAMYFFVAANTGHQALTSLHGNSSVEAMDKLIDYMTWESSYNKEQLMKMFRHIDTTIVYLKDFKIKEISNISGYDENKKDFTYKRVF